MLPHLSDQRSIKGYKCFFSLKSLDGYSDASKETKPCDDDNTSFFTWPPLHINGLPSSQHAQQFSRMLDTI